MILDFNKFEKGYTILETTSPDDASESLLESSGLTRDDLTYINEGLFGDLFGGWFKKMKTVLLRKIPGGILKKVDEIVKKYEAEKMALMKKGLGEKEKIFKAELSAEKDPSSAKRYEQIIDRSKQAIAAIKKASDAKIEKFNTELEQISADKSDMITDYINLKIAEVKERVAMSELKEIEKFATEEQVTKVEKEVQDKTNKRETLQKELEASAKAEKDLPYMLAKKGEKWVRKNKKGEEVTVELVAEPNDPKPGEIQVKSDGGTLYSALLPSLIRKADEKSEVKQIKTNKESSINKIKTNNDEA